MYDTLFVMYLRLRKGQSPFLALRTISPCGWRWATTVQIVVMAAAAAAVLSFCAFLVTQMTWVWALVIYLLVLAEILLLSRALAQVTMK